MADLRKTTQRKKRQMEICFCLRLGECEKYYPMFLWAPKYWKIEKVNVICTNFEISQSDETGLSKVFLQIKVIISEQTVPF